MKSDLISRFAPLRDVLRVVVSRKGKTGAPGSFTTVHGAPETVREKRGGVARQGGLL